MGEGQAATLLLGSWKIWAQTNQKRDKTERKNVLEGTEMSLVGLIPATATTPRDFGVLLITAYGKHLPPGKSHPKSPRLRFPIAPMTPASPT